MKQINVELVFRKTTLMAIWGINENRMKLGSKESSVSATQECLVVKSLASYIELNSGPALLFISFMTLCQIFNSLINKFSPHL